MNCWNVRRGLQFARGICGIERCLWSRGLLECYVIIMSEEHTNRLWWEWWWWCDSRDSSLCSSENSLYHKRINYQLLRIITITTLSNYRIVSTSSINETKNSQNERSFSLFRTIICFSNNKRQNKFPTEYLYQMHLLPISQNHHAKTVTPKFHMHTILNNEY